MALSKSTLERALKEMPSPDKIKPADAANNLAKALTKYFREAGAADTTVTLSSGPLASILLGSMGPNQLLTKLGTSIQTWALSWTFVSGTFTGPAGTTTVNGAALTPMLTAFSASSQASQPKDPLSDLAKIIHTWATSGSIVVALINNQSGSPAPAPVI